MRVRTIPFRSPIGTTGGDCTSLVKPFPGSSATTRARRCIATPARRPDGLVPTAREPRAPVRRLRAMTNDRPLHSARLARAAAAAILLALVAACSSPGSIASPGATSTPTAGPTTSPTAIPGLQHPTGATDVILRMETGGGFAPIEFMATNAPIFTLYGDGTAIWRDPTAAQPDPIGGVNRLAPFHVARLGEDGIQALLDEALGQGALGVAVGPYIGAGADIPSTTFTIAVNGAVKQVTVVGLSPEMHPQDQLIVGALSHLAERLQGFASVVSGQIYTPSGYRGVLTSIDQPFGPVVAWPWPAVSADDFVKGPNDFLTTRTMSPTEVTALGIPGIEGGLSSLNLSKDGKLYSFSLRPLLPDETK